MGATLQVSPDQLVTTAADLTSVGEFVAGMTAGQPMTGAVTGMSGLAAGAACHFAAAVLAGAANVVGGELAAHSAALSTAADHYRRTDADLGRRLAE